MNRHRPALNPAQIAFTFDPPSPASAPGDLAGLDRMVASAVARALKDDPRSREEIAGAMSAQLGETVSKLMLDAYASESRDNHNIPVHRALALIAVTKRFDLLDAMVRRIGAAVLIGRDLAVAKRGHLQAQLNQLKDEIRTLDRTLEPMQASAT